MKVLFTSILALFLAVPAWATGELSAPATCDTTDLGVSSGTLNVDLVWQANTINTTWYSNGTALSGNGVPSSCTYDAVLVPPTPDARPGYTFGGWRVHVAPACTIPSTDVSNNGNAYAAKRLIGKNYSTYGGATAATYGISAPGEWGVSWENGDKVTGVALCSAQSGDNHSREWGGNSSDWTSDETTLTSATGETQHCWCKATHYTANNAQQCSLSSPAWVFESDRGSASACRIYCAHRCAVYVQGNSDFREALFGGNVAPEPAVPTCLIPSTDVSTDGSSYGYKNDSTGPQGADSNNTSDYNLTEDNTWGVTWSNGDKVTGEAFCSTTDDGKNWGETGNPGTIGGYAAGGQYCWCRATHYTANNAQQCALSSPAWVFSNGDLGSASACASACAHECARIVQLFGSVFRAALFTGLVAQ